MGYYVTIVKSTCVIPVENCQEVLQIWKDLNKPEYNDLKNGGCWKGGEQNSWWYSWMTNDYDQTCHSVGDVLTQLGFKYGINDNGDVAIGGYDNKSGQEELFFEHVEHLLVGAIHWKDEDGKKWSWTYSNQMTKAELIARITHLDKETYDLDCELNSYSDEVVKDRVISGIVAAMDSYEKNYNNLPDDALLIDLLNHIRISLEYLDG